MKKAEDYKIILWHKYLRSGGKDILIRYLHALAVMNKAEELIKRFSLPVHPDKAYVAALLHDYAKFEKEEEFLRIAKKYNVEEIIASSSPKIWHALLGPYIISEELGITDKEILDAVRYHASGAENMSVLDEVIFLADFIDDTRVEHYFDEVKAAAKINFRKAISLKFLQRIKEAGEQKQLINLYNKYAEVKWNS